ncbi:MAG: DUF4070 domain-containing protein [Ignavibacteriales bacterium]|nr:DUF4070 domain-containing protein [Ignavibacteriales bacterium]
MFGHRPRIKTHRAGDRRTGRPLRGSAGAGRSSSWTTTSSATSARCKEELLPALIALAEGASRGIAVLHRGVDQPRRRRGADAADGRGGLQPGVRRHRDARGGRVWPSATSARTSGRDLVADVKRIQRAGLRGAGRVHRRLRQRHAHDLPAADRVHPARAGSSPRWSACCTALPGTKLYQRLQREGRLLGRTTGDNVDGTTNFVPRMNDARRCARATGASCKRIYAPGPYYQRVRTFLREYQPPKVSLSFNWRLAHGVRLRQSCASASSAASAYQYWRLLAVDVLPPAQPVAARRSRSRSTATTSAGAVPRWRTDARAGAGLRVHRIHRSRQGRKRSPRGSGARSCALPIGRRTPAQQTQRYARRHKFLPKTHPAAARHAAVQLPRRQIPSREGIPERGRQSGSPLERGGRRPGCVADFRRFV